MTPVSNKQNACYQIIKTYMYHLFFLLLIGGCKHEKADKIDIIKVNFESEATTNLSDVTNKHEVIRLETAEECLISRLSDLYITKDYLFILDGGRRLLQFSRNGKFIKPIGKRGKGPFEYNMIHSFTCDTVKEQIYIGALRNIHCYSFKGEPLFSIKQNKIDDFMSVQNSQLWTFFTEYGQKDATTFVNRQYLTTYNEEGLYLDSIPLKEIILPNQVGSTMRPLQYISNTHTGVFFYYPILIQESSVRDTLYQIINNSIKPSVKIDFGAHTVHPQNPKRKGIHIKNIYRSNRYLFAWYSTAINKQSYLLCHDLNTGMQYNLKDGIKDNIYNTGKIVLKQLNTPNDHMYFVKDAFEVHNVIEGVSEDSNPVVFIIILNN
jgi:hypothetical protein